MQRKQTLRRVQVGSFTAIVADGTGTGTIGLSEYTQALVLVDVTAVTGVTPTIDLYLDTQLTGTTWVNLARFTAITTVGQYIAAITGNQVTSTLLGNVVTDAGAGTVRNMQWGDAMRERRVTTGTFTATVWFIGFG